MSDQSPIRVLFVDDEPRIIQGLQRMLRTMRSEWDMCFVGGGEEALVEMERCPADVVVSDMRMPGINGAQLLDAVMKRWPSTIRIILSGHADQELIQRSVGSTHQYLQKPCDAEVLKSTITHARNLRRLLGDPILRTLVGGVESLPSLPALYHEIMTLMHSSDVSARQIGELVAKDMAMSAKVLQLVNSAFFGARRTIINPAEAATILGIDTLSGLIMAIPIFSRIDPSLLDEFDLSGLWQESVGVSLLAKRIAHDGGLSAVQAEEACVAGVMHDIGSLLLVAHCPERYRQVKNARAPGVPRFEQERAIWGADHGPIGAYLLGLWGISDAIVEAVAYHHMPHRSDRISFSPLTCVHVANSLYHDPSGVSVENRLDDHYLVALGLDDRLPVWADMARAVKGKS